jgi:adenosylcobinamide-phosphate synthase
VIEAAFAAALGVHLGGTNRYGRRVEQRATLGRGRATTPADIGAAVKLSRQLNGMLIAALAAAAAAPTAARLVRGR